jgi:hypothetical protein
MRLERKSYLCPLVVTLNLLLILHQELLEQILEKDLVINGSEEVHLFILFSFEVLNIICIKGVNSLKIVILQRSICRIVLEFLLIFTWKVSILLVSNST